MRAEVVHDNNVAGSEHGHEQLLDISTEAPAVNGAIEDARRCQAVTTQGTKERQGAPVAMWDETT